MDQLWLPDIFIYNLHSIKKHKFIYDFDGIFLGNDTEIDYEITFEVRIYCPMEFESYPLGCVHLLILNTFFHEKIKNSPKIVTKVHVG